MIAACPKCAARYRIEREKLKPEGVRLRCTRCEAVFKVRPPEEVAEAVAERAAPPERGEAEATAPVRRPAAREEARDREPEGEARGPGGPPPDCAVLVAMPGEDLAKQTAEALRARGLEPAVVHDGVEAMLEIQRRLPRAVVLSATLPRMYGFQICEIVKRNESLRSIFVVLAGSIHHKERYRRPPGDLYGADAYLEEPDLPEGLLPLLERAGLALTPAAAPRSRAARPEPRRPEPLARPEPAVRLEPARPASRPHAESASALRGDGLDEMRARAERLARIIVSDIILYNEQKFAEAVRRGDVATALSGDLEEGRALFRERVDERVRAEKDHLVEELVRVARSRGMS